MQGLSVDEQPSMVDIIGTKKKPYSTGDKEEEEEEEHNENRKYITTMATYI